MDKIILLILGAIIGWLVGIHFWVVFKIAAILLGGYLTFASAIFYGFSGNAKESSYFAWIGIPLIIGIISGWLAISSYTIDGTLKSISDFFSAEKVKEKKVTTDSNLAETLKQLEEAGVITINNKKE
jgi:hypothetical protein